MNALPPIDISLPWPSPEALNTGPPFAGTTAMVHGDALLAFPLDEPEPFSLDWLADYRALKRLKFAFYFGAALILDLSDWQQEEITAAAIIARLKPLLAGTRDGEPVAAPARVLIKTGKRTPEPSYLSVDAIEYLHSRGACLIGIDSPSIDQPGQSTNESLCARKKLSWLVNIDFSRTEGVNHCFLAALPLFDLSSGPSPARAYVIPQVEM